MIRKQLLRFLVPLLVAASLAMAGASQLTGVHVDTDGKTTSITIQANGTFTHTEYRPADNLLMVDLTGVSAAQLDGHSESVQVPGVSSYRVLGFKGPNGSDVARVELTVAPAAVVKFSDVEGGVLVRVLGNGPVARSKPAPPASQAVVDEPEPIVLGGPASPVTPAVLKPAKPAATAAAAPKLEKTKLVNAVAVRNVHVTKTPDGMDVQITSTGPLKPEAQTLENPNRLVIDLPGAMWDYAPKQIAVKAGDVKSVRLALWQEDPPITRVVVDLTQAREYDLVPADNGLHVKLHAASQNVPAPVAAASAQPAPAISAAPAPQVEIQQAATAPASVPVQKSQSSVSLSIAPQAAQARPAPTPAVVAAAPPAPSPVVVKDAEPMPLPSAKPAPAPVAPPSSKLVASKPAQPVLMASATPAPSLAPQPTVAPVQNIQAAKAEATPPVQAQPAPQSNTAQQFVMVQPTMTQKTEDPSAKPATPAPAADTGSKFPTQSQIAMASGLNQPIPMQAAAATPAPAPAPAQMAPRPKYTGEPISVNLKDVDLKDFFRLIHEISGLNIVLDPNVHGSLTLVLDDVPWDQALDIVLKNNGLERELDGNVLRIATVDTLRHEADSRRAQIEAKSMADPKITVTRFLSYAHSKDVVPIVKKFLSQRGEIISDDRTNGLIMQDIPSVFPEIDRILTQLDRKTPEVEIEARVVAATRSFARDIGTQLGFAFANRASAVGGAPQVGASPISVTTPTTPPYLVLPGAQSGNSIPLFSNLPAIGATSGVSLSNIGSNYRIDAILTLAESRGLLKILSRPRVVTQNNIQANVRQGVQIPITTTSQLSGPPTTTYVNAFLRLTVTPQITIENTIFLNVDVENTTPDFGHVAPLTGNPTLLTQQATTQVLVTDGGTVVIGGVIQTNNSVTINQVPFLGNLPGLGNLFKRRAVQTQTQELFFFITPKIIQT